MSYSDFEVEDEVTYGDEMGAYLRASLPGENINRNSGLKLEHGLLAPIDIFTDEIGAISRNLQSSLEVVKPKNKEIMLNERDILFLKDTATKLKHVNYKNPTAYILGFLVTKGQDEINVKSFEYITKHVLNLLLDDSVKAEDIIRYARLWMLHLAP